MKNQRKDLSRGLFLVITLSSLSVGAAFLSAQSVNPATDKVILSTTRSISKNPEDTYLWGRHIFNSDLEEDMLYEFVNRAIVFPVDEVIDGEFEPIVNSSFDYTEPVIEMPVYVEPQYAEPSQIETSQEFPIALTENSSPTAYVAPTEEEMLAARTAWAKRKFAGRISKTEGSRGVIIYYGDADYYDIARLESFFLDGRDRIVTEAGLDADQIDVIYGGYRGHVEAEFWFVPVGGKEPEARPQDRPNDLSAILSDELR